MSLSRGCSILDLKISPLSLVSTTVAPRHRPTILFQRIVSQGASGAYAELEGAREPQWLGMKKRARNNFPISIWRLFVRVSRHRRLQDHRSPAAAAVADLALKRGADVGHGSPLASKLTGPLVDRIALRGRLATGPGGGEEGVDVGIASEVQSGQRRFLISARNVATVPLVQQLFFSLRTPGGQLAMLRFLGPGTCLCDGWNRREVMRIGGLGCCGVGLSLAELMRPSASAASALAGGSSFGRARSCIILFLMGGPPQHSTWDPKPDAPAQVRGAFGPIATTVPGISISELLPRTALVADKLCILRGMSTGDNAHSSSGYYMLTGRPHQPMNFENANPGPPNDVPSLGAVLGRVERARGGLPLSATLPHRIFNTDGSVWPGQDAGFLGRTFDPWLLNSRLTAEGYRIQEIDLPAELDTGRLSRRQSLLETFQRGLETLDHTSPARAFDEQERRAFDLLGSSQARRAFRLEEEPNANRDFVWRDSVRPECAARAPPGGVRSPARPGELVPRARRASSQPLLGQPRQRICAAQGGARTADRPGLRCAHCGSGPSRPSQRNAGRLYG